MQAIGPGYPGYFDRAGTPASPADLSKHQTVIYLQEGGAVRAVLAEWSLPPHDLWAVFPTGRSATAKARVFVDVFEHNFNP